MDTFPYKLYGLLQTLEKSSTTGDEEVGSCIAWLPHGRAFIIRNKDAFVSKVVPAYFQQTSMRSFSRQLNLWGFQRVKSGSEAGSWYHRRFLRGNPSFLAHIKRTAVKSAVKRNTTEAKEAKLCFKGPIAPGTPEKVMADIVINHNHLTFGREGQSVQALKSEELTNPYLLANRYQELKLKQLAAMRLPVYDNNWNVHGLNKSVLGTDDFGTKTIQLTCKDMPSCQVSRKQLPEPWEYLKDDDSLSHQEWG